MRSILFISALSPVWMQIHYTLRLWTIKLLLLAKGMVSDFILHQLLAHPLCCFERDIYHKSWKQWARFNRYRVPCSVQQNETHVMNKFPILLTVGFILWGFHLFRPDTFSVPFPTKPQCTLCMTKLCNKNVTFYLGCMPAAFAGNSLQGSN